MLQFDPQTHRYRNAETGRFVKYSEVLKVVGEEVNRLEVRLKGHARLLNQGKIDIAEFQTRIAQSLKESHLRNAAVGAGGVEQFTPTHYGKVGAELKKQYQFLDGFGKDLADGKLSEKQILSRAAMYAASSRTSFFEAEFTSRGKYGFLAKRLLDPQSRHCDSCISLQRLEWTPIHRLTPPGVNCQCGGRCRCRLVYQKRSYGGFRFS
ncbi:hypothetical protein [Iningainema tapete]|uniref:Uncharacterized protein n=1 Tax=Iningainema tapete BLCC-T55 TaxID=2748662 RepID=A0A8J6XPL8_9CYAN|nr:hypothetical protein [Iningainema tapete]MBD2771148.1 hypothetical protein [Iningainema tapete BLCC-T55]